MKALLIFIALAALVLLGVLALFAWAVTVTFSVPFIQAYVGVLVAYSLISLGTAGNTPSRK